MPNPTSSLSGKVAIVTGAASGLGKAIAERLVQEGAQVVFSDISHIGAEAARAVGAHFIQSDSSQRQECKRLIDQTLARFKTIHILVNNAGFQHIAPIEDFPEDQWEKMQAVMLTAPFLLTKYAWPAMKAQRWGRIINVASVHGVVASPFKSAYVAAKHGLIGLTKTTALEGGELGITVNAICPAYVKTPLVDKQIAAQAQTRGISEKDVVEKVMLEPAAIKRLIEPSEVADFAAYLCTPAGAVITGASLMMDLGWTAR